MSRKKKNKHKIKFTYTNRLEGILMEISDNISFAILGSYQNETDSGIRLLDIDSEAFFKIYKEGAKSSERISVRHFLDVFFGENKFSNYEISSFLYDYNSKISSNEIDCVKVDMTPFQKDFKYNPKDVAYTFKSLCYQTYPFGTESDILRFIDLPLETDDFGNYYIKIGELSQ